MKYKYEFQQSASPREVVPEILSGSLKLLAEQCSTVQGSNRLMLIKHDSKGMGAPL